MPGIKEQIAEKKAEIASYGTVPCSAKQDNEWANESI